MMKHMPKALKITLFALGGLAGLLVLAALAAYFLVDADSWKPRAEAAASAAMKMDVTIEGPMRLAFTPAFRVTLEKVRVRNLGAEIAFVEEAKVEIAPWSLLEDKLRFGDIALDRARISIEWRDGKYNYQRPLVDLAKIGALDVPKIAFTNLLVAYADKAAGIALEARDCKGELNHLHRPAATRFLVRLSASGQFTCGEVRGKDLAVTDLEFPVQATEGVFDFKPVTMRAFGGKGSGSLRADHTSGTPDYRLDYALAKFHVEHLFKGMPPGYTVSGLMDFSIHLAMRGRRGKLPQSAEGVVSLGGNNLMLNGVDLDRALAKYESTQSFNLFDLGAVLFAGPFGLVVSRGYQLSTVAAAGVGNSGIRTLVSKWKVEKGVAHAVDVALATNDNRLALHGGLDFVNDEFDEVVIAQVDANGCAKLRERVRGPFGKPVVEKPGAVEAIAGPVANLLKKAKELFPTAAGKCEVFYNGSVTARK
jgi:AsmA protein